MLVVGRGGMADGMALSVVLELLLDVVVVVREGPLVGLLLRLLVVVVVLLLGVVVVVVVVGKAKGGGGGIPAGKMAVKAGEDDCDVAGEV